MSKDDQQEPTVLDNLFKKGTSGNPGGRVSSPADVKAIQKFNRHELTRVIHKYMNMDLGDMASMTQPINKEYLKKLPVIEVAILKIMSDAVAGGDHKKLDFLLNRLIGRVKIEAEISTKDPGEEYQGGVLILPPNGRG